MLQSFNLTPTATWPTATHRDDRRIASTTSTTTSTRRRPSTSTTTSTTSTSAAPETRYIVDNTQPAVGHRPRRLDRRRLRRRAPTTTGPIARRSSPRRTPADFLGGFDVPGTRCSPYRPTSTRRPCSPTSTTARPARPTAPNRSTTDASPVCRGRGPTAPAATPASRSLPPARQTPRSRSSPRCKRQPTTARPPRSSTRSPSSTARRTRRPRCRHRPHRRCRSRLRCCLGSVQPGAVTVVDTSGSISVSVPPEWTQRRLDGPFNDDMTRVAAHRRRHRCRRHVRRVDDTWRDLRRVSVHDDAATLLANLGWDDDCDDGGVQIVRQRHVHRVPADVDRVRWHRDAHRLGRGEPGGQLGDAAPRGAASRPPTTPRCRPCSPRSSNAEAVNWQRRRRRATPAGRLGPAPLAIGSCRSGTRRRPQPPRS